MIKTRHFIFSALAAVLIHVGIFLPWVKSDASEGAIAEGQDGLMVSVGLAGALTENKAEPENEAIDEAKKEQKSEPKTEPETQPEPELETQLDPEPQPETVSEPIPELIPETKPEPKPEPLPAPKPEPKPVPKPQPKPVQKPIQKTEKQVEQSSSTEQLANNDNADTKKNTSISSHATGIGKQVETGGNPAARQSYMSKVAALIARHKRYPRGARKDGVTGTVTVSFTIIKNGRVEESKVLTSSGDPRLDQEALDVLLRASPFPFIPDDLGTNSISITLPIEFSLNQRRKLF